MYIKLYAHITLKITGKIIKIKVKVRIKAYNVCPNGGIRSDVQKHLPRSFVRSLLVCCYLVIDDEWQEVERIYIYMSIQPRELPLWQTERCYHNLQDQRTTYIVNCSNFRFTICAHYACAFFAFSHSCSYIHIHIYLDVHLSMYLYEYFYVHIVLIAGMCVYLF